MESEPVVGDYTEMSESEFWNHVIEENAENTDLTEEELLEKPMWEIEEILDINLSNVSMPRGNRGGFCVSDRKEVITAEERQERRDRVERELGLD